MLLKEIQSRELKLHYELI